MGNGWYLKQKNYDTSVFKTEKIHDYIIEMSSVYKRLVTVRRTQPKLFLGDVCFC
eukprot:UN12791